MEEKRGELREGKGERSWGSHALGSSEMKSAGHLSQLVHRPLGAGTITHIPASSYPL